MPETGEDRGFSKWSGARALIAERPGTVIGRFVLGPECHDWDEELRDFYDDRDDTYTFSSKGREGEPPKWPPKGTKLAGVMLAGVDDESRPYLITVNSKEGTLSSRDVVDIIDSVALRDTKK
ncbi:hypothetical protein ABZ568_10560 [Streptomyces olindensis]|uniref:Uncharacterized protein n=1 Tax=Streptomyces olindensis TaxID=358823 RepID=A0ABV2XSE1_9ACTN